VREVDISVLLDSEKTSFLIFSLKKSKENEIPPLFLRIPFPEFSLEK